MDHERDNRQAQQGTGAVERGRAGADSPESDDLGALFGIELASSAPRVAARRGAPGARAKGKAVKLKPPRTKPRRKPGAGKNTGSAAGKSRKTSKPRDGALVMSIVSLLLNYFVAANW